jgi:hypothetical protein
VIEERPGFGGALAIVEVAYDAGGKDRPAIPAWLLALGAGALVIALVRPGANLLKNGGGRGI